MRKKGLELKLCSRFELLGHQIWQSGSPELKLCSGFELLGHQIELSGGPELKLCGRLEHCGDTNAHQLQQKGRQYPPTGSRKAQKGYHKSTEKGKLLPQ